MGKHYKNQWINEEIKDDIRKYLKTNDNGNTTFQNLWDKGTSMAVQWLRLCTSNAGGVGSNLVGELLIRSHMLYGMVPSPNNHHQKKKKTTHRINPKSMGRNNSSSKREHYSDTSIPQETKISNNLTYHLWELEK